MTARSSWNQLNTGGHRPPLQPPHPRLTRKFNCTTTREPFLAYCIRKGGSVMRMNAFIFALVLSVPGPALAQEWVEYVNTQDGFKVNFPGQPKVTETTWKSQLDY